MKRYDKYKPSGVEWVGEIPEHWEIRRIKFLTYNLDAKRIPLSSDQRGLKRGDYPYYGATGIIDYIDEFLFEGKYVLVGEDGAPFFIKNRDVAFVAEGKFWVNNHAHILESNGKLLPELLARQMNLVDYRAYISGSTRDKLTQSELNEIRLVNIPKDEQTAIASFLDEKTAQIDTLVQKKNKLIELLKEERTAVINHAVTKGLTYDEKGLKDDHDYTKKKSRRSNNQANQGSDNIRMKPSGIEWLGDIPAHWEVKKLKYVAKIQSSNVDKKTNEGEKAILLCNYIDVYRNEFIDDSISFMEATATEKEIQKFILIEGDVLITKDSETPDDIANPAYVVKDFENVICGYHLAQIRANHTELHGEYLFRLFQSKQFNTNFEVSANGVTRFGLPLDSITDVFVPLPSAEEQARITDYILNENNKIDATISKIEKEIDLLQEYRTALISEVVTGKICVL